VALRRVDSLRWVLGVWGIRSNVETGSSRGLGRMICGSDRRESWQSFLHVSIGDETLEALRVSESRRCRGVVLGTPYDGGAELPQNCPVAQVPDSLQYLALSTVVPMFPPQATSITQASLLQIAPPTTCAASGTGLVLVAAQRPSPAQSSDGSSKTNMETHPIGDIIG